MNDIDTTEALLEWESLPYFEVYTTTRDEPIHVAGDTAVLGKIGELTVLQISTGAATTAVFDYRVLTGWVKK